MHTDSSGARPLNEFPQGSEVVIRHVCGCDRSRGRLCAMGLTPGTRVIIMSSGNGSCRVRVRNSDLALGHRMAGHTLAVPAGDDDLQEGTCPDLERCMDEDFCRTESRLERFLHACGCPWHRNGHGHRHGRRQGKGRNSP